MAATKRTNNLFQTEADSRASSIRAGVQYECFFHFQKGEGYSGIMQATFQLTDLEHVFFDYAGAGISALVVNGTAVEDAPSRFKYSRVQLPRELLRLGHVNTAVVVFQNKYYKDGNGLHSFTDTDGKQYLYTQSEPFWGNRVWPIFDQPDLKGNLVIHAAAPEDWLIITSTEATQHLPTYSGFLALAAHSDFQRLVAREYPALDGHSYWHFSPSIALSTYLYNIVCGPYRRIDLEEAQRYDGIPMAIYCRDSLLPFAQEQAHNIFQFHKLGIKRYDELFGLKYPFGKCDALFCPEFTVGAMEYPGAITYTERLLPREQNTVSMVSLRGSIILHELAHMWFGNTVTMRWWDDLWLNESFADFVCYQNWADIRPQLGFETYDAWLSFMGRKGWGYKEDQESTTHPIAGAVVSTEQAENIFDGITYSKGASTMRQISSLVGTERFYKALGKYFRKFQFRNTRLSDLIESLQQELDSDKTDDRHKAFDLKHWEQSWLLTSGLNTVRVEWKKGAGKQTIKLHQGAALPEHPTLRFHRINLGFFNEDGKLADEKEIILEDREVTEVEIGDNSFAAVLPNYRDYSFIKIVLDEDSSTFFKANFQHLEEPLTKGLVIRSLYDGVRDATFRASDFIALCCTAIEHEKSIQVIDLIYGFVGAAAAVITEKNRSAALSKLYRVTRAKLVTFTEPATIRSMLQKLIHYGVVAEDVEDLRTWLEGTNADLAKYELAIADKWSITFKSFGVAVQSPEQLKALYDKLYAEDASDTKKSFELKIKALTATDAERDALWEQYFGEQSSLSYRDVESSLEGFTSGYVPLERRQKHFDLFFTQILAATRTKSRELGRTLFDGIFSPIDDHNLKLERLSEIAAQVKEEEVFQKKTFNQSIEELKRLKRQREFDTSA